jgi:hypothetical protein
MKLYALEPINYCGAAGITQLRNFQCELSAAFIAADWHRVRRLERSCSILMEHVIRANKGDLGAITAALVELKGVYESLLASCASEGAVMAY